MKHKEHYTDEWGVTYCDYGRTLMRVDPQRFTCVEYAIPEGVERVMDDAFLMKNAKLRKILFPNTLRELGCNTFLRYPLEELELPEGMIRFLIIKHYSYTYEIGKLYIMIVYLCGEEIMK